MSDLDKPDTTLEPQQELELLPPQPEGSTWTEGQWRAIVRRNRNLLVAAAAGSGKTAVLVQRIIRRISDEANPVDVDRLLVATFTKAAASEMRHRIGAALEEALYQNPDSDHLKKQLALLNRASITTLHSFCMEVIQRYFQFVDLDPGFRIADDTEGALIRQEQLEGLLESRYSEAPEEHPFWLLAEWFGGERSDNALMELIERLYEAARSHPFPASWLEEMASMYRGPGQVWLNPDQHPWFQNLIKSVELELMGASALLEEALRLCKEPAGPAPYAANLDEELALIRCLQELASKGWLALYSGFQNISFGRLKPCKGDEYNKDLQEQVKELRKGAKDRLDKLREELFVRSPEEYAAELQSMAPVMEELITLTLEFGDRYKAAKTDKGLVDFTDLEHYCLQILGSYSEGKGMLPTAAALAYREQFVEIMLDEYQDTNLVQETIVSLIAREEPGNRFMVGDVKQSIYRFRLAEPGLFLAKSRSYASASDPGGATDVASHGERIDLARNFRSRRQVVDGVNFLFRQIMRESVGEMEYDTSAELVCGASYPENRLSEAEEVGRTPDYSTELLLIDRGGPASGTSSTEGSFSSEEEDSAALEGADSTSTGQGAQEAEELEAAQLEARLIGQRIRKLMGLDGGVPFPVTDKKGEQRPAGFRDFVILLRATRSWAPVFIEELAQMGIPAYADVSSGYFSATEVETMVSLLKLIDNPHQDIPLAAVLRSPIVGLSAEHLATIRGAYKKAEYYEAVQSWLYGIGERLRMEEERSSVSLLPEAPEQLELFGDGLYSEGLPLLLGAAAEAAAALEVGGRQSAAPTAGDLALFHKLSSFMRKLAEWRDESRQGSLSELIWTIYRETGYFDYVGGLPGGNQRQANLKALYDRARQYEKTSFRGLFRFLRFVERLRDSGGDLGTARAIGEQEDVVRIMSIHKSKGLEFPVVFVAGMGKMFNLMDLNGSFLIHKELGFGPKYVHSELRAVYPTLPQLAIRKKMYMETLAEEMRVLYVALTRAKEKLILIGAVASLEGKLSRWSRSLNNEMPYLPDYMLAEARSYLDWVVPAALRHPSAEVIFSVTPGAPGRKLYCNDSSEWSFEIIASTAIGGINAINGFHEETLTEKQERLKQYESAIRRLEPLSVPEPNWQVELDRRLRWTYPFEGAATMLTKTSVSELKRMSSYRILQVTGEGLEWQTPLHPAVEQRWSNKPMLYRQPKFRSERKLTSAELGTLYHTVMQHMPYGHIPDRLELDSLLVKLQEKRVLSQLEREALDTSIIEAFYQTDIGQRYGLSNNVYRELPFSFGLKAGEVYPDCTPAVAEETLLIQGVIDCLFEDCEGRLVLLDFKTDRTAGIKEEDLANRYKLQIQLYARAIEQTWKQKLDDKLVYFFDGARLIRYNS